VSPNNGAAPAPAPQDSEQEKARQAISLGAEAFEDHKIAEAIEHFREAAEADIPSEDRAYACLMLAQCLMEEQESGEALEVLEKAGGFPDLSSEMQRDLLYYKGILSTVGKV
jgi:Tfp pilus assembly protein PilF